MKLCKSLSNQKVEWWKCHEVRMQLQNAKYKMQRRILQMQNLKFEMQKAKKK